MSLLGTSIIGASRGNGSKVTTHAINPATGEKLEPAYLGATSEEVARALELAAAAFPKYSRLSGKERGAFLRAIAGEIETVADEIAARGPLETGLPEARLRGETARTTGQLRLFAALAEEGSWVDARIEHAQPDRQPLAKVDLRSMLRPLGPVAVFAASNFPLAFSVAGGDTASALAAGCPVIVKAHSSHPGVSEIVGAAVRRAAEKTGMPEGVFSLLYGGGRDVGIALVEAPQIKAVGFTGSRSGGTALMAAAAKRPEPIPVYAEMSSINPVVFLPEILAQKGEVLAEGLFGSLTMGVGQFCTNPGLVFLEENSAGPFLAKLKTLVEAGAPGVMLNSAICEAYHSATSDLAKKKDVAVLAKAAAAPGQGQGSPVVFQTSVDTFTADPELCAEMFGPATLVITGSLEKITAAIVDLEGQLTTSIHGTDTEIAQVDDLLAAMENRSGRVIFNGFPTGVEVCHSMVHGGPFPSTSDGRSTSVGSMAIHRFARPISWQSAPQSALPAELRDGNPSGIWRMIDGQRGQG
ncbi:MAG: aldehyde dehydrogenase (NADP(+)) [Verrucomicrobiota bacterium]